MGKAGDSLEPTQPGRVVHFRQSYCWTFRRLTSHRSHLMQDVMTLEKPQIVSKKLHIKDVM
jgi:hypothetical protein